MTSYTPAQIERFKREAKLLHRASAIPHSQALDRVAAANGYSNWSLLRKHSDAHGATHSNGGPSPFRFKRTPAEMRTAFFKVPEPRGWGTSRSDVAREQVDDISRDFLSSQNAVAFAIDYMTCLLTVPRFKIYAAAPVYWEMRAWLPYACKKIADGVYIPVNRRYKPVGQVGEEWAKYEDFPNLHARLTDDHCKQFRVPDASDGYLFDDGCPPWHSRVEAVAYLERLHRLRDSLQK